MGRQRYHTLQVQSHQSRRRWNLWLVARNESAKRSWSSTLSAPRRDPPTYAYDEPKNLRLNLGLVEALHEGLSHGSLLRSCSGPTQHRKDRKWEKNSSQTHRVHTTDEICMMSTPHAYHKPRHLLLHSVCIHVEYILNIRDWSVKINVFHPFLPHGSHFLLLSRHF